MLIVEVVGCVGLRLDSRNVVAVIPDDRLGCAFRMSSKTHGQLLDWEIYDATDRTLHHFSRPCRTFERL